MGSTGRGPPIFGPEPWTEHASAVWSQFPSDPAAPFELLADIVEDADHIGKHASFTATRELDYETADTRHLGGSRSRLGYGPTA